MENEQAIVFIKPRAIEEGQLGNIINLICDAQVNIIGMKMLLLPLSVAGMIFKNYSGTPLYEILVKDLTSAPSVITVLKGKHPLSWLPQLMQIENRIVPIENELNYLNSSFIYRPKTVEEGLEQVRYLFAGYELQDY